MSITSEKSKSITVLKSQKQILTKDKGEKIGKVHKIRYRLKSQKSSRSEGGDMVYFMLIYN